MVDLWCTVRVWLEGPDERSRERVRGPAPGRKLKAVHREVPWPAGTLEVTSGNLGEPSDIFSDRSRRFPINRGRGGGRVRNFFRNFFFFASLGGGRGGGRGGEGDPETRGTSCAIPSWNVPKSIFRSRSRRKSVTKCDRSMKKCHQIFIYLN